MRVLKVLLAIALALLPAGCKHINEIDEKLSEYEQRIAALEASVSTLQSQMDIVQKLLGGKYFVYDVVTLEDNKGYKLRLTDSFNNLTEVELLNGVTPVISVRKDTDGVWYWTVNGEWLLADGEKVRVNGEEGATPQVKIEDGKWFVSFDGLSWVYVGDAVPDGLGLISSVDFDSDPRNVVFTLADGSTFLVPKSAAALKLQVLFDDTPFTQMEAGTTASASYEVVVPQGVTYTFSTYEPDGWTVVIAQSPLDRGTITVSLPSDARPGKILFVLNGSDGSSYVRVVEVGVPLREEYLVDSAGGTIVVSGAEELTSKADYPWLSVAGNNVTVSKNASYDSRTALLSYTDASSAVHTVVIIQAQTNAIVLSASRVEVSPDGGEVPFVLSANVPLQASVDADWLTVVPATRGLSELPFVIRADSNTGTDSREAVVTFSYEDMSQQVKVVQAAYKDAILTVKGYGCMLGSLSRLYVPGKDQLIREYKKDGVTFIIADPVDLERLRVDGYDIDISEGDKVSLSVDWKKGNKSLVEASYRMTVLKVDDEKAWLGDGKGNGMVVKL